MPPAFHRASPFTSPHAKTTTYWRFTTLPANPSCVIPASRFRSFGMKPSLAIGLRVREIVRIGRGHSPPPAQRGPRRAFGRQ